MKDKILAFLKVKGPIVPTELSGHLGVQSMIASAYLSDLTSSKQVLISRMKFGNSPLYYLPEHHEKLEGFSDHLHKKEQEALAMLKAKGVLRDSLVEPVIRVALREIKDFSVPLEVTYQGKVEVFWKHWSLGPDEGKEKIRAYLEGSEVARPAVQVVKPEPVLEPVKEEISRPALEPVEQIKHVEQEREVVVESEPVKLEEVKRGVESSDDDVLSKPKVKVATMKKKPVKEKQQSLEPDEIDDKFMLKVIEHFNSQEVEVIEAELVKTDGECNFVISMETALGTCAFYCKAKNKKRISEGDITSLFAEASLRNLPGAFVSTGELSKPAEKTLIQFPSLIFVQI